MSTSHKRLSVASGAPGSTDQGDLCAAYPHFEQIRKRFGPPRLAVLPIGAYLPRWFMSPIHIDPIQAVEAHQILQSRQSVGMHYDTFALADEAYGQAPRDLHAAMKKAAVDPSDFWTLAFGEGRYVGK